MITMTGMVNVQFVNRYLTTTEVANGDAILLPSVTNVIYIPVAFTINNFNCGFSLTSSDLINNTTLDSFTGSHNVPNNVCKTIMLKDTLCDVGAIRYTFTPITPVGKDVYISLLYYTIPKQ